MSFDINYDIPTIITKRNVDSMENPIGVKLLEKKQVMDNHSCIVLSQIPDENYRITIEGFNEVFNSDELGNNNFYVSYSQGVIYFLPRYNGKTVVVEYYGIGYELISASRVFYKYDKHGGIIETLEEILDNAKEQLELIKTLGDSVKVIEKLEMDLENGKVLHDNLENDIEVGTPLQENLHSDIVEAKKWKDQLHQDVTDGKVLQPLLQQTVDDAEDVKVRLDKSIADAQEDIATIEATGNKEVIIKSSDWRLNGDVYEKEITHPCNSENLHVTAKNSNTKEAVTIGYKILDKTRILLKSDEAINMSVILSASYYHATQTISDDIAEEVVKARKGETSLDVKITKINEQLDKKANEVDLDFVATTIHNVININDKINKSTGNIKFENKVYTLIEPIVIKGHTTYDGNNCTINISKTTPIKLPKGEEYIHFKNFNFVGDLKFTKIVELLDNGCKIRCEENVFSVGDMLGASIYGKYDKPYVTVTNFDGIYYTLDVSLSEDGNVLNSEFGKIIGTFNWGSLIAGGKNNDNIIFENCTFTNSFGYSLALPNTSNIKIENCKFVDNGLDFILFSAEDRDISNITIKSCIFDKVFYKHHLFLVQ